MIELILVLAVVGVLAAFGSSSLLDARQRAQLAEAQAFVVVELERSRAKAQDGQDALVEWTANSVNGRALRDGFTITTAPGSFTYTAPHGRTTLGDGLELELEDAQGHTARVAVVGVTGKTYRRAIE